MQQLIEKALRVAENAYAPYSNFQVGSAVMFESGNIYVGCNVENASYGLCLCAERNAISSAIANGEKSKLKAIAIVSKNTKKCFPCGACRQWLIEFNPEAMVIVQGDKDYISYSAKELLPKAFEL